MSRFTLYSTVRIRYLAQAPEEYDGWRVNQRPPRVGDTGVLIDILHAPGSPERFVVESSGPDGVTIWLADFDADEVETIASA